jgi:ornithine cyclodeaminase/alanine dehydrogenase-like protein (mu-crystallin family)
MLLLNNQDVEKLLTAADCIEVLEESYREWAFGQAAQFPKEGRMDLTAPSPGSELNRRFTWGAMAGVVPKYGIFALRQKLDLHYQRAHPGGELTLDKYCIQPGTYCGFILLVSTRNAEPLAIVNDGVFQHLRVAGTSAVAAKYLARENAEVLGLIGSGGMARSHIQCFCAIRPIKLVRVYSMTPANRERFAREMTASLGVEVRAMDTPEAAVKDADIVSFCTDSVKPIFPSLDWMQPGMHFTGVLTGELGRAPERADVIILHERGGIVEEKATGEGLPDPEATVWSPYGMNRERDRQDLPTLAELVADMATGRTHPGQVTYFHNGPGAGIQFAAVGAKLYEQALKRGVGQEFPTQWLLQDIRD